MNRTTNGSRAILRIFGFAVPVVTLYLGLLYGIINNEFFDEKTYMFLRGAESMLKAYYTFCAVITAILAVSYFVFRFRKADLTAAVSIGKGETEHALSKAVRMAGGAIFAVGAVMRLVSSFNQDPSSPLPAIVTVPMLIFYVCLSIYFFPEADKKLGVGGFTAFCGILGTVAIIIDTLATYADMSIPIASEYRILTAVCNILFLLTLVSELRIKLAEPKPYSYLALTAVASTVVGSVSIGRMISILSGKTVSGAELARTVCGIGITVYLFSRFIAITVATKPESYIENCGGIPFEALPPIPENETKEKDDEQ